MVRTLYFSKEGQHRRSFWRCAVCRAHHNSKDGDGTMVMVGNVCMGMVCGDSCPQVVRDAIEKLMPDAVPDVDEKTGQLLR